MAGDTTRIKRAAGSLAAALVAAAALAGCGQDAKTPVVTPAAPHVKANTPVKKGPSADELTAGMAAAPTLGKSSLPLDLKFELGDRPKIGHVLDIDLAVLPQVSGGPATVRAAGEAGIEAAPGEDQFELPQLEAGEVYRHTLRVTPSSEGVLLVGITVTLKHDDIDDSRVFSVPVIVDR